MPTAARQYQSGLEYLTLTIANGASLSDAGTLKGKTVVAVITPAAWTAAALTFQVDGGDGTFRSLRSSSEGTTTEVKIASADVPTAESVQFAFPPHYFLGCAQVKVQSGLDGAAVNQGGARSVLLVVRSL